MTRTASSPETGRPELFSARASVATASEVLPETVGVVAPPSEMQGAGAATAGCGNPACALPSTRLTGRFTLYHIAEVATGRGYVGVTQQGLAARMAGHWHHAARIHHRHRDGSLGQALRQAFLQGRRFADVFAVRVLEVVDDAALARTREAAWIAALRTMAPQGYNLLPGGASLGGPSNCQPVTIVMASGEARDFPSLGAAWRCWRGIWQAAQAEQRAEWVSLGLHLPMLGLAHARIGLGWRTEEALGLTPHRDRRGRRDGGVLVDGVWCQHLREAHDVASVPTLRSRLHRARQTRLDAQPDLALDRRRQGQPKQSRRIVRLPDPADPAGPRALTLRDLAARSGIAFATMQHRLRRLERQDLDPDTLSGPDLLQHLLAPTADRRTVLTLRLPGGRLLSGGQRELARLVQDDPALQPLRVEVLSEPAIRRRLRLAGAGAGQRALRWALGLRGGRAPDGTTAATRPGAGR